MKVVIRVPWKREESTAFTSSPTTLLHKQKDNILESENQQNRNLQRKQIINAELSVTNTRRDAEEQKWTREKDQQLRIFLAMSKHPIQWELITNELKGMSVEECVKRSEFLFEQQLQLIHSQQQQKRNSFEGSIQSGNVSNSKSSTISTSLLKTSKLKEPPPTERNVKNPSINFKELQEVVLKHDFDWVSISKELGDINPHECRRLYIENVEKNITEKQTEEYVISPESSLTMTEMILALNSSGTSNGSQSN